MNNKKVNILGTEYQISINDYKDDPAFEKNKLVGYCDPYIKQIVICNLFTYEEWKDEPDETKKICMKETLRHEIIHAFFNESGLESSSLQYDGPYAKNEEMVDWIALQGPKIYEAWKEADAL